MKEKSEIADALRELGELIKDHHKVIDDAVQQYYLDHNIPVPAKKSSVADKMDEIRVQSRVLEDQIDEYLKIFFERYNYYLTHDKRMKILVLIPSFPKNEEELDCDYGRWESETKKLDFLAEDGRIKDEYIRIEKEIENETNETD